MKTSIVLKMLAGAAITVLTVTGIALSVTNASYQNMADVSVIAETNSQVAEAIVNAKITSDKIKIVESDAEATMTSSDYFVNDEQSIDVALADAQSDNAVDAADKQKSDIVKKSDSTKKSDIAKESDIKQQSDDAKESDIVADAVNTQSPDIVQTPVNAQSPDIVQMPVNAQTPVTAQSPDVAQESAAPQQPNAAQGAVPTQQPNTETEQSGDTSGVEELAYGIGGSDPVIGYSEERLVFEIPADEEPVDDDCIVAYRYCGCGASFAFRKNSGIDGSWSDHVKAHVANGESVRYTDN